MEASGIVKEIIEKVFNRAGNLLKIAVVCVLVYMIAHASSLMPAVGMPFLQVPDMIVPWMNFAAIVGVACVVVELLWKVGAWMCRQVEEWRLEKAEAEDAALQDMKEKMSIQEFDAILNGKLCPLWHTVTERMYGKRVFELDTMHPHVLYLCRKHIIQLVDKGHLKEDGRHFATYTFTPWIADHIAEEEMRAERESLHIAE